MITRILTIVSLITGISFGQMPRFKLIGSCDLRPSSRYDCFDVIVLDTLAFLADEDLTVINIAHPDSPFIVTKIDTTHTFRNAIAPTPPYFYAMGVYGLGSFDISDLQSPVFLDSIGISLWGDMVLYNEYAYCSGGYLHLADVSTPDTLEYLGIIDSTILAGRLTTGTDYLYELVHTCSLFVYDISNPANPQKVGSCSLPHAWGLSESEPFFKDSLLFIPRASFWGSHIALWVVNVADPYNPFLIAESPDTGEYINRTFDLTVSGNYAYATFGCQFFPRQGQPVRQEHPYNVAVFEVVRPLEPKPVWIYEAYDGINYKGIDSRADTIYLCDGFSFSIYVDTLWTGICHEAENVITQTSLLEVYPNPTESPGMAATIAVTGYKVECIL